MESGWKIRGAKCGRDRTGRFVCVCGKCEPLCGNQSNDGDNYSGNGSHSSNSGKDKRC